MVRKRLRTFLIAILVCCLAATFYYTQKPIVLTIGVFAGSNWNVPSPYSGKIIDNVIERFEKTHPNVQVEYVSGILKEDYSDWVSKEALNGKLPDVFMVLSDDLSTYAKVGMLEPLDTFMQTDADFNKNRYFSTTLNAGNIYDHQYALPYESSPTLMFVNKTLLEENGIAIPNVNWTWDDFYSICEKLTVDTDGDGEIDQFGEYGYTWRNALSSNGQALYDEESMKCTLQKQDVYSAIEFVRQLNRLNRNQNVTSELFDKGKIAICPMMFSEYRTYKPYPWSVKKYSSFEWDCLPMPAGPSGNNVSQMDSLLCGIRKMSSKKKMAWEFLKLLCYDETTQESLFKYSQGVSVLKNVSTSKNVTKYIQEDAPLDSNYNLDFFDDMMEQAITIKKLDGYDQLYSMADSEIRRVIDTNEDIELAMQNLNDELNILLEKQ